MPSHVYRSLATVLQSSLYVCVAYDWNRKHMYGYSFTYYRKGAQASRRTCRNSTGEDRELFRSSSSSPATEPKGQFFPSGRPLGAIITINDPDCYSKCRWGNIRNQPLHTPGRWIIRQERSRRASLQMPDILHTRTRY